MGTRQEFDRRGEAFVQETLMLMAQILIVFFVVVVVCVVRDIAFGSAIMHECCKVQSFLIFLVFLKCTVHASVVPQGHRPHCQVHLCLYSILTCTFTNRATNQANIHTPSVAHDVPQPALQAPMHDAELAAVPMWTKHTMYVRIHHPMWYTKKKREEITMHQQLSQPVDIDVAMHAVHAALEHAHAPLLPAHFAFPVDDVHTPVDDVRMTPPTPCVPPHVPRVVLLEHPPGVVQQCIGFHMQCIVLWMQCIVAPAPSGHADVVAAGSAHAPFVVPPWQRVLLHAVSVEQSMLRSTHFHALVVEQSMLLCVGFVMPTDPQHAVR